MGMIDQLANELMIASLLMHTNNVSKIATEIGYKPILIINALYRGHETGKFKYDKKKDIITISPDVDTEKLAVSEGTVELREQIEIFIGYLNGDEKDMSIQEMQMLLGGTPELHIKIAVTTSDKLTSYQLQDPKDKESTYTFITLNENLDKQFGKSQFVDKKTRAAKAVERVKNREQ